MANNVLDSQIVKQLHEKATYGGTVSDEEWFELRKQAGEYLPQFVKALHQFDYHLSQKEIDVCMLIKLRFSPTELCNLFGMSASAVSNMRSRLYEKLYKEKGSSTAFDERIRNIHG